MAEPVDNHEADVFVSQLWRHIYQRMAALMHPHARAHEPGGIDPLKLPLGSLVDVTIDTPVIGQVIVCTAADNAGGTWGNGAGGGGGGGPQEKTYCYAGTLALDAGGLVLPNHTGKTWTVSAIYAELGTAPGTGSVAFTANAGGGTWSGTVTSVASDTGRSDSVADGASLSVVITGIGTVTPPADLSVTFVYTQAA
jgi:hypothetical protein